MIRIIEQRGFTDTLKYIDAAGLSTDEKPVTGIITGSRFTEADTGDVYMFYEGDSPAWGKIAAGPAAEP